MSCCSDVMKPIGPSSCCTPQDTAAKAAQTMRDSGCGCASLGVQNAANSLGQAIGPVVRGALFIWQINAPYLLTGASLITVARVTGWKR